MKKVTWSCEPSPAGYVITASTWVRGRQPCAKLFIPVCALQNNIPMTYLLSGAIYTLAQGLADVARTVPATH
jgi:hypothetical protein